MGDIGSRQVRFEVLPGSLPPGQHEPHEPARADAQLPADTQLLVDAQLPADTQLPVERRRTAARAEPARR